MPDTAAERRTHTGRAPRCYRVARHCRADTRRPPSDTGSVSEKESILGTCYLRLTRRLKQQTMPDTAAERRMHTGRVSRCYHEGRRCRADTKRPRAIPDD